jgi:hypothetical protein
VSRHTRCVSPAPPQWAEYRAGRSRVPDRRGPVTDPRVHRRPDHAPPPYSRSATTTAPRASKRPHSHAIPHPPVTKPTTIPQPEQAPGWGVSIGAASSQRLCEILAGAQWRRHNARESTPIFASFRKIVGHGTVCGPGAVEGYAATGPFSCELVRFGPDRVGNGCCRQSSTVAGPATEVSRGQLGARDGALRDRYRHFTSVPVGSEPLAHAGLSGSWPSNINRCRHPARPPLSSRWPRRRWVLTRSTTLRITREVLRGEVGPAFAQNA